MINILNSDVNFAVMLKKQFSNKPSFGTRAPNCPSNPHGPEKGLRTNVASLNVSLNKIERANSNAIARDFDGLVH